MKKNLNTAISVKSSRVGDQQLLKITVPPESVKDWLLCLHLLADNLIGNCGLVNVNAATKLELLLGSKCGWAAGRQHGSFTITLDRASLSYLRSFFGKYYRDGFAEVDHIDLEPDEPHGSYITIAVQEYAAALSPEDITEMLSSEPGERGA